MPLSTSRSSRGASEPIALSGSIQLFHSAPCFVIMIMIMKHNQLMKVMIESPADRSKQKFSQPLSQKDAHLAVAGIADGNTETIRLQCEVYCATSCKWSCVPSAYIDTPWKWGLWFHFVQWLASDQLCSDCVSHWQVKSWNTFSLAPISQCIYECSTDNSESIHMSALGKLTLPQSTDLLRLRIHQNHIFRLRFKMCWPGMNKASRRQSSSRTLSNYCLT